VLRGHEGIIADVLIIPEENGHWPKLGIGNSFRRDGLKDLTFGGGDENIRRK